MVPLCLLKPHIDGISFGTLGHRKDWLTDLLNGEKVNSCGTIVWGTLLNEKFVEIAS